MPKVALGQTESVTDPSGTIVYSYLLSGNVEQINALGATTTMSYDKAGRQETLHEPNAGLISYTYNPYGELMEQTDARGNTYKMKYDNLGRIYEKTLVSTGGRTQYFYNDNPPAQGSTGGGYGKIDQLLGDNEIEYRYLYDNLDRIEIQTELHPGVTNP